MVRSFLPSISSVMYCASRITALLVVVTTRNKPQIDFFVDGFSSQLGKPHLRCTGQLTCENLSVSKKVRLTISFGILDDLMGEEIDNDLDQNDNDDNERMIELYHSLIFASDLRSEISKRLNDCTDPDFLEYLNSSLSESSHDEDEQQGLAELISRIDEVKKIEAKKTADDQEKALVSAKAKDEIGEKLENSAPARSSEPISNADILRKANEIDAAIALSDEEKPSDFISDCREVVNLSRGFNDSGQMRVGGG